MMYREREAASECVESSFSSLGESSIGFSFSPSTVVHAAVATAAPSTQLPVEPSPSLLTTSLAATFLSSWSEMNEDTINK